MVTRPKRDKSGSPPFDELGGTPDGGVTIVGRDGSVIHQTPHRIAGALRYFVARTDFSGPEQLPQRLAVLAALRGEGATFVSRSLAAVIAHDTERSVVHIDLNWRLPGTGSGGRRPGRRAKQPTRARRRRRSTSPALPGNERSVLTLADAVERDAAVAEIVRPTLNPRLSLIDAGELPLARHAAVAGSATLESIVGKLSTEFDQLIFDLPSVLASSDAIRLAQLADAYVLVVRQGRTSTGQIEAALDELRGQESLGVILNRVSSRVPRSLRRMLGA
jgi:Mrp family chromosome partitioning ATPase